MTKEELMAIRDAAEFAVALSKHPELRDWDTVNRAAQLQGAEWKKKHPDGVHWDYNEDLKR